MKSPGLRNAEIETSAVKSIFTADPDDARLMAHDLASPKQVSTSKYYHKSKADREKQKKAKMIKKAQRQARKDRASKASAERRGGSRQSRFHQLSSSSSSEASNSEDRYVCCTFTSSLVYVLFSIYIHTYIYLLTIIHT